MSNWQLLHADGRAPTGLQLRLADNAWLRLRGLLGRPCPAPAEGLWIRPCNAVHSAFMGYPIDLLYLDAQQRVLRVRETLKPWRVDLHWPAVSVIELAAGECRRLHIQPGDRLQCATTP